MLFIKFLQTLHCIKNYNVFAVRLRYRCLHISYYYSQTLIFQPRFLTLYDNKIRNNSAQFQTSMTNGFMLSMTILSGFICFLQYMKKHSAFWSNVQCLSTIKCLNKSSRYLLCICLKEG